MSTIKIDTSLQQVLAGITEASQIVDADGKVLGIFTPQSQVDAELRAMAARVFDPEHLDRIKREESGKGISYAEVKKRLQSLENQA